MAPLRCFLVAAAALTILAQSSTARAERPVEVPTAPNPGPSVAPQDEATSTLPRPIMRVLGVLEVVGVAEIDKTSALVSSIGVIDTARLEFRAPTWLAPEPPKMPLFFSRLVQLKF